MRSILILLSLLLMIFVSPFVWAGQVGSGIVKQKVVDVHVGILEVSDCAVIIAIIQPTETYNYITNNARREAGKTALTEAINHKEAAVLTDKTV